MLVFWNKVSGYFLVWLFNLIFYMFDEICIVKYGIFLLNVLMLSMKWFVIDGIGKIIVFFGSWMDIFNLLLLFR